MPELEVDVEEVPVVEDVVDAALCEAVRSPNRFVVPRSAPRLDCGPVALAEEVVVFVEVEVAGGVALVESVEELEPVEDELDDELDEEELDEPLPPLDRFPDSRGANNPANCSAEIFPLRRIELSTSPSDTTAVRTESSGVFVSREAGLAPSLA